MLSNSSKKKTTLYVATNSVHENNEYHFNTNQRKIVKSSSNYNLMAYNNSSTRRSDRNIADDAITESNLQRSDSFSSVKFFNEGEKLVSQLCDSCVEEPEEKVEQYNVATILGKDKTNSLKKITEQSDVCRCEDSVSSQIVQLAIEACTIAENIAVANKNRPCFKNIQTICEKTKSNVQKPDAAVANLHSQGVPWVIKNFIFSFVRILDGWKGVKELLSEKHESFKRIENQYYSPQIRECFFEWQVSTKNMLENISKTFSALDSGFQAEQQRYKRYSGVNLLALQNKDPKQKQQIRRESPGPVASLVSAATQPQLSHFYNQWQNNNIHSIPQSMSHGNMLSQWSAQSTSKVNPMPYQNTITPTHKHENLEFGKPAAPGNIKILPNKEERKMTTNLMVQQSVGNITNQHNEDLAIKQQFLSTNSTSENAIQSNADFKKAIPAVDTLPFLSSNWSYNNEVFNPYPNYWINQSDCENKHYCNVQNETINYNSVINMKGNASVSSSNPTTYPTPGNIVMNVDNYGDMADSSAVYMNPGSYNLPINKKVHTHNTNADFGTVESITVHNSAIVKESEAPFTKTILNAFPPILKESPYNILKKSPTDISSPDLSLNNSCALSTNTNKSVIKAAEGADNEWETAIQQVPKFITSNHQSPSETSTDYQKLCNVLECNSNKNDDDVNNSESRHCIENVSWNKISQQFFGGCHQPDLHINYLSNMEPNFKNTILHDIAKSDNQIDFQNTELNLQDISDEKFESADSFEVCQSENNFGSTESLKKVKKKNSQNFKYSGKKRNDYIASGIKKMENIFVTLWNMDRSWPLDKEPKMAEIVKNIVTFPIVSDRLKGFYYTDVYQVADDIRTIFYNAHEYLKVYPDEKLKMQTDEMQACFEKMFSEDILNTDKGKPKNRTDFHN